jgi:drug/metabolite transporter (DMT)-like permease
VLLSGGGGSFEGQLTGFAALGAACLAWGIDNNLTARLSGRNAVDLVRFKALMAGAGNLVLATAAGHPLPALRVAVFSLAVGFVSYGLSIVLDVYALRYIGAARESAYFATAPFVGAVAAIPLLGERMRTREIAAGLVMAVGVTLLIAGRSNELHQSQAH